MTLCLNSILMLNWIVWNRTVLIFNCYQKFILISKLATIVEGDSMAPFSISTTGVISRCKGERYSFPGLLHFTLDLYLIMLSVKQGSIKYHFLSIIWLGIEPRSPRLLVNTLLIGPMARLNWIVWNFYQNDLIRC